MEHIQTSHEKVKNQIKQMLNEGVCYAKCNDDDTKDSLEKALEVMGYKYTRTIVLIHNEWYEYKDDKTPPKKYIEMLNEMDEEIEILKSKMDEEIKNIMKNRGLECDDELEMEIDDISYGLGLDDLYDEYDLLLNKMAQQAIEV